MGNTAYNVYGQDGIRFRGESGTTIYSGTISGNTCYANDASGVQLQWAGSTIVEHNTCYNNGQAFTGGPSGISNLLGAPNSIIRYNLCYDNLDKFISDGNGIIMDETTGFQQVYYNICYGNDGDGINVLGSDSVYVYNNLFYDNNQDRSSTHTAAPDRNAEITLVNAGTNSCVVKNNICYNINTGYAISITDGAASGGHILDYNCWFKQSGNWGYYDTDAYSNISNWTTASSQDANSIISDPQFISAIPNSPSDFKLRTDSPCANAGTEVNLNKDFLGHQVPNSTAPDIGAIELYDIYPPSNLKVITNH